MKLPTNCRECGAQIQWISERVADAVSYAAANPDGSDHLHPPPSRHRERNDHPEVAAFLDEIAEVCRKHGMGISHQDGHGAFIVERFSLELVKWLNDAEVQL